MEDEYSDENVNEVHRAQSELQRQLAIEERLCKTRAHVKWLDARDKNIRFFHATVK